MCQCLVILVALYTTVKEILLLFLMGIRKSNLNEVPSSHRPNANHPSIGAVPLHHCFFDLSRYLSLMSA